MHTSTLSQKPGTGSIATVCAQPGWLRLGLSVEPLAQFNEKEPLGPHTPPSPSPQQLVLAAGHTELHTGVRRALRLCACVFGQMCVHDLSALPRLPFQPGLPRGVWTSPASQHAVPTQRPLQTC